MLEFKKIKKDDVFYECEGGRNTKFIALEDAHREIKDMQYWIFKGRRISTGEVINFGSREGLSHYGPKLYKEPEYVNVRSFKAEID